MLTLVSMNEQDFKTYFNQAIELYAKELFHSGACNKDEASEISQKTFNQVLPEGLGTAGQYLYQIKKDHELVGMIWFGTKANAEANEAFIYDFSILESQRGKGYGTKTLELMETNAKHKGFKKISLHVFGHNKAAIALYQKCGYEPYSMHMAKKIE